MRFFNPFPNSSFKFCINCYNSGYSCYPYRHPIPLWIFLNYWGNVLAPSKSVTKLPFDFNGARISPVAVMTSCCNEFHKLWCSCLNCKRIKPSSLLRAMPHNWTTNAIQLPQAKHIFVVNSRTAHYPWQNAPQSMNIKDQTQLSLLRREFGPQSFNQRDGSKMYSCN